MNPPRGSSRRFPVQKSQQVLIAYNLRARIGLLDGGAHRGSQGADAVCGNNNIFCNFIALFIQSCDTATYWIRSSDDVQVRLGA